MPTTRNGRLPGNGPAPAGFTLLELLVVMVLAGTLVAVALPNLQRLYGAVARNSERAHILDQIAALGRDALAHRRAYFLRDARREDGGRGETPGAEFTPYPLNLPAGWRLRVDEPVLARANGVCLGGAVTLLHDDAPPAHLVLAAPLCRVAETGRPGHAPPEPTPPRRGHAQRVSSP